ncbi:hypothetical protein NBH00_21850 [Paraconexibacter antarcticus]|uniref:Thioredoxin domain-containing protein n=1 Tax=Paraconexibacter antarcticus TaxID=2949664 RepID=A0ABY5DTC2_9ACTN|nr:hypothetical protein [Paraconexibacter antarcticus]UTI63972.1 hypothetical protein NBH00_21850 [Paraconexibacter antarcticus]
MRFPLSVAPLVLVLATGCGSSSGTSTPTTSKAAAGPDASLPPALAAKLTAAEHPRAADFPATGGRSLQALAKLVAPGPRIGLAASVLLPGENRVAFGLIGADNRFVYGRSALYVASSPSAAAQGPFLAPADSFVPSAPFLSKTAAADTADIKAIYATQLTFRKAGSYAVLAVSRVGNRLLGAASTLKVQASSPIPGVGERPPAISTDTVASSGGDLSKIDTRLPHDDMHRVDFKDVIGKKPVVLLFATPQLCQSRVCGPVTDLELELEHTYGDRATFIHEEVYAQNDVSKGLRPQLRAFHLQTEPWLFTFDRRGRVAARLEGAFGINAFRAAVQAAIGR